MWATTSGIADAAAIPIYLVYEGGKWIWKKVKENKAEKAKRGALMQKAAAARFTALMSQAHQISRQRNEALAKTETNQVPGQDQLGLSQDKGKYLEMLKNASPVVLIGGGLLLFMALRR